LCNFLQRRLAVTFGWGAQTAPPYERRVHGRVYDYRFFDWVTLSLRFRVFVLVPVTFSALTIVAVGEGVEQRESADRSRLSATTLWRNIARRLLEVGTYEAAEGR
jgi:hypothetical protein